MNTLNDAPAQQVFKTMAVHRSQLAALADLGDDDGDPDIRLPGDRVIRNFPWPIGIEVRRLLNGSMREPDRRRRLPYNWRVPTVSRPWSFFQMPKRDGACTNWTPPQEMMCRPWTIWQPMRECTGSGPRTSLRTK